MSRDTFFIKIALLLGLCNGYRSSAQLITTDDSATLKKRYLLTGLPVVFYTPETRFGFGATGIFLFNFKSDTLQARKSSLNLGFAYTQNKQAIFNLPFNLFIKNRSYHVYGELSYYKFFYNFYGVGNDMPIDYLERYGVEYPRIRLTALKKVSKHVFVGLRYAFDKFRLFDLDTAGLMIRKTIKGTEGGTVSGFGLVGLYDSRDDIFYPSRGWWGEMVVYHDDPATGSSYKYTRVTLDMSKYFSYKHNILALNAYSLYSNTDLPFFQMGILGGQKRMRGFYEGRYRDNNALVFQAEYRRYLFWVLGITVFGNVGQVAPRYDQFNANNWRYTYGAGLRLALNQKQKLNLRIDFAIGNGKLLPYFTAGEAF